MCNLYHTCVDIVTSTPTQGRGRETNIPEFNPMETPGPSNGEIPSFMSENDKENIEDDKKPCKPTNPQLLQKHLLGNLQMNFTPISTPGSVNREPPSFLCEGDMNREDSPLKGDIPAMPNFLDDKPVDSDIDIFNNNMNDIQEVPGFISFNEQPEVAAGKVKARGGPENGKFGVHGVAGIIDKNS